MDIRELYAQCVGPSTGINLNRAEESIAHDIRTNGPEALSYWERLGLVHIPAGGMTIDLNRVEQALAMIRECIGPQTAPATAYKVIRFTDMGDEWLVEIRVSEHSVLAEEWTPGALEQYLNKLADQSKLTVDKLHPPE